MRKQVLDEIRVEKAFDIVPSNTEDLQEDTIAIYIGGEGDLTVELISGEVITMSNIATGAWHPIAVRKVFETGTTCDDIVGAYK